MEARYCYTTEEDALSFDVVLKNASPTLGHEVTIRVHELDIGILLWVFRGHVVEVLEGERVRAILREQHVDAPPTWSDLPWDTILAFDGYDRGSPKWKLLSARRCIWQ